eukprot:Lithocolla_globosa_v1_NODE_218_length_5069_cov_37.778620.p3 type:complete len:191 gc:universal NODE_218_length_5069_cov_37.778620:4528-3956(-)
MALSPPYLHAPLRPLLLRPLSLTAPVAPSLPHLQPRNSLHQLPLGWVPAGRLLQRHLCPKRQPQRSLYKGRDALSLSLLRLWRVALPHERLSHPPTYSRRSLTATLRSWSTSCCRIAWTPCNAPSVRTCSLFTVVSSAWSKQLLSSQRNPVGTTASPPTSPSWVRGSLALPYNVQWMARSLPRLPPTRNN